MRSRKTTNLLETTGSHSSAGTTSRVVRFWYTLVTTVMNTDRVIRELDIRLSHLSDADRQEVRDALREEIARERRWVEPELTVEAERERRVESETLRDVLEGIVRQVRLEDTVEEVLKQLARIATYDFAALALLDPGDRFRVLAARGAAEPVALVGTTFPVPTDVPPEERWPINVGDSESDPRAFPLPGAPPLRAWVGLPLLVEGEVIGLLCFGRTQPDPYTDEELHRVRTVVFSAAAVIRKAQLLEHVRRYALLMEQVVVVDQLVFSGAKAPDVARAILEAAIQFGSYEGGLLVLQTAQGPVVAAGAGDGFQGIEGRKAPASLAATTLRRLEPARLAEAAAALGTSLPAQALFLVPLHTSDSYVGTLALLDPNGESPDDRLMESFASRAAAAYLHAGRPRA
jgi:GAF domain